MGVVWGMIFIVNIVNLFLFRSVLNSERDEKEVVQGEER